MYANQFYELSYNEGKNLIDLKVKGNWNSEDNVPHYIRHWVSILSEVKPGFKILTDLLDMKNLSPEVRSIHRQTNLMIVYSGVHKIAQLSSNPEKKEMLNSIGSASGIRQLTSVFNNKDEAMKWLDE
jgi:hypothetical protein